MVLSVRRLLLLLALLGLPGSAWAQFANIGSAEGEFSAASVDSRTLAAVAVPDLGAERVGIVLVSRLISSDTTSSVTWCGDAMTERADASGTGMSVSIYDLVGMDDNQNCDIVVTFATTNLHSAHVVAIWADHGSAITFDDADTGSGTAQDPAITSTGTAGAASYLMVSTSAHEATTPTGITGATLLQDWDEGNRVHQAGYSQSSSSGDQTHTHTHNASDTYVIGSAMYRAGTASAGGTPPRLLLLGVGEP